MRTYAGLVGSVLVLACVDRPVIPDAEDEVGDTSSESDSQESDSESDSETETQNTTSDTQTDTAEPCDPVVFEDPELEAEVRSRLGLAEGEVLDPVQLATLDNLQMIDRNLASLAGLECATGLISLDVSINQITDLGPIAGLGLLEELRVRDNQITTLPALASTPSLRNVDLRRNPLTDVAALAGAGALELLIVDDTEITSLDPLADALQLRRLFANGAPITDLDFANDLGQLVFLDVANTQITDLSPLAGLPQLEDLAIDDDAITDLSPLTTLPSLVRLGMSNTGQADLAVLAGLPLEVLGAAGNGIVDVTPITTFTPPEMTYLDLSDNAITDLSPFADTVWTGGGCGLELLLEGNPVASSPTLEQDHPYICQLGLWVVWNADEGSWCGDPPCP